MEKIFHYTTINTLTLILSNKTLRFNSLSNVDDMEEGQFGDFGDLSRYVFVSSWTKERTENIALWNMYTPLMTGIRIGVYPNNVQPQFTEDKEVHNIHNFANISCFAPSDFLRDIIYVDNPQKRNLISPSGILSSKEIEAMGKFKDRGWTFQSESRFMLMAIPRKSLWSSKILPNQIKFNESLFHKVKSELNYVDLVIDDKFWMDAEILLGPNTSLAEERIVKCLINQYAKDIKITVSKSNLKLRRKIFA